MLCCCAQPASAQLVGALVGQTAEQSAEQPAESTTSGDSKKTESAISKFSNFFVSYLGGYQDFDKGFYGIGWESFSESGIMANLSFNGSWGITDPGEYMFRVGAGYGYAPVDFAAITARINAMGSSYTKYEYNHKTGKIDKEDKFGGGILVAPGVRLKLSKIVIGVNFDLGWAYLGGSGFYKDVQLSLGYTF